MVSSYPFNSIVLAFRDIVKDAGPATMEQAIECLSTLTNFSTVRINELGGQPEVKEKLSDAWRLIHDAGRAVQP